MVELVIEKPDGASAYVVNEGGGPQPQAHLTLVLEGYSAPVTAGNFATNVLQKLYVGKTLTVDYTGILVGKGTVSGGHTPCTPSQLLSAPLSACSCYKTRCVPDNMGAAGSRCPVHSFLLFIFIYLFGNRHGVLDASQDIRSINPLGFYMSALRNHMLGSCSEQTSVSCHLAAMRLMGNGVK